MQRFFLRRFINMIIVLWGVVTITFFIMRFTDGDPATIIYLAKYGTELISPEVIKELAEKEGLNKPLPFQYAAWIKKLLSGDLGKSLKTGEPVIKEIMCRFPYTLMLAVLSIGITALIAVPLGIYSSFNKDGWLDRITRTIASFTVSIPNYYLAIILIIIFSVKITLLPSYGFGGAEHFILPLIVLVSSKAGYILRITRSTVLDILSSDYTRYAVVRGLSKNRILLVHVLKNALIPIFTYLSLQFIMAIEGSIIVETIFAWPGIGQLMKDSIFGRDFTMIQGLVLFIGILITFINFIVDVFYLFINQRLNLAGQRA